MSYLLRAAASAVIELSRSSTAEASETIPHSVEAASGLVSEVLVEFSFASSSLAMDWISLVYTASIPSGDNQASPMNLGSRAEHLSRNLMLLTSVYLNIYLSVKMYEIFNNTFLPHLL